VYLPQIAAKRQMILPQIVMAYCRQVCDDILGCRQESDAISTHAELDRSVDSVLHNVDNNVTVNAGSTTIVAPGAWGEPGARIRSPLLA
jgi:hypothetical protein